MATSRQKDHSFAGAERLEAGDRIPAFGLPDSDGTLVNPLSDHLAGRPLLLVFECGGHSGGTGYADELAALRDRAGALTARDAVVLAVTRRSCNENATLEQEEALPFPLLSDPEARSYAACGLDPARIGRPTVTLVLDGNLRVLGVVDGGGATRWREIVGALEAVASGTGGELSNSHAPVIVLPRVLTPEDCARLIEVWYRRVRIWDGDGFTTRGFDKEDGDFKVRNKDYGHVVQLVVRDAALQNYLDAKIQRRIMPEIAKAFATKVTRREDYRIAGYDASLGGSLGPHRDNATRETRHRRFTFCVTLNGGDFEGGGLRFREYHDEGYRVPTGTAIVWSCNLLHEVLPVTAGQRFILGTHLFGN